MKWSSVLGVAALSITLRHSSALAPTATDHEAIGVGSKGDVSVEKPRSKSGALMRSHSGAHSEDEHGPEKHHAHHEHKKDSMAGWKDDGFPGSHSEDEHGQEKHHAHHEHNKEHKHHHEHHEGADTQLADTEPATRGFSAVDPEKIHANHEHASKSHVDHEAQEHKDGQDSEEGDESHKKSKPHHHKFHHESVDAEGESLAEEEEDSEFLPALGMNNPADLAYRAMDIMMGIASIIPEDYPFVCICDLTGKCVEKGAPPGKEAGCKMRIGQMAAAPGTTLSVAITLVAMIAAMLN